MAVQLIRRKRTSQPKSAAKIDWNNPLTLGLQTLFDGARYLDVVSNQTLSPRSPKTCIGGGLAHEVTTSNTAAVLPNQVFKNADGLTAFVLLEHGDTMSTTYAGLTSRGAYGVDDNTTIYIEGGALMAYGPSGGGGGGPIGSLASGGIHSYAATCRGTSLIGYVDGASPTGVSGAWTAASTPNAVCIGATGSDHVADEYGPGKYLLVGWWNRALAAREIRDLHKNPWQLFEPETIPLFFSTVTAQYSRPTSDVSAGTWTASSGSDLFAMLDETAANDSDYIVTTGVSTCEVALGSLTDPYVSTGHIVRYRISATGGGIIVRLRQGTTTIASWTHSPAPTSLTTYEQTLSGAEADSITSYAALKLQFEATP